jgi:hypothetical protein
LESEKQLSVETEQWSLYGAGTLSAFSSFRSRPNVGCSKVPDIRTGTISPLRFFLKNGSIIFSKNAFCPRVVF